MRKPFKRYSEVFGPVVVAFRIEGDSPDDVSYELVTADGSVWEYDDPISGGCGWHRVTDSIMEPEAWEEA
jgi:hypothetical protein